MSKRIATAIRVKIFDITDTAAPVQIAERTTAMEEKTSVRFTALATPDARKGTYFEIVMQHIYDDPQSGNVQDGFQITLANSSRNMHTLLIREGCDGSPSCAMEWYIGKGLDYLNEGPNIHFSDSELEEVYQAVKAVRKQRRRNA